MDYITIRGRHNYHTDNTGMYRYSIHCVPYSLSDFALGVDPNNPIIAIKNGENVSLGDPDATLFYTIDLFNKDGRILAILLWSVHCDSYMHRLNIAINMNGVDGDLIDVKLCQETYDNMKEMMEHIRKYMHLIVEV